MTTETTAAPPRSAREYPDRPWIGVGAIVFKGDHVLLIRRGKPPNQGKWSLPGGAQEIGETVYQTAVREVLEETGLVIAVTRLVTVVDSIHRDDDGRVQYHYTLIDVSAEWVSGDPVCGDDADEACWVTVEEAAGLVSWVETARVIRMAAAQRAAP